MNQGPSAPSRSARMARSTGIALFVVAAAVGFFVIGEYNYLLFHSIADLLIILVSTITFIVVWSGRQRPDNGYFQLIGLSLLFYALFDFLHLLGAAGMGVFPRYGNLGPVFYLISRYLLALSFLMAPFFIRRRFPVGIVTVGYAVVTVVLILSVFTWRNFPATTLEGGGLTPFKILSDYGISAVLLISSVPLMRRNEAFDDRVRWLLLVSLFLSAAAGFVFTLYQVPTGLVSVGAHYLQIASFVLIFFAIIETGLSSPRDLVFHVLSRTNLQFADLNEALEKANADLTSKIAELERTERDLNRYARELENMNQELEAFAYSLSHDLRAPLRALDGFSQAVMDDYGDRLDDIGRDHIRRVRGAAQTMAHITEDMLMLFQITRNDMKWEPVDLSGMAREIPTLVRTAPDRDMRIEVAPDVHAMGDPSLLHIVLFNLLENAVKFTATVPRTLVEFTTTMQGNDIVYQVKDNGIGFDMAYSDKLFQPFQRLHSSLGFPGQGIGLTTVQKVVLKHGGRIWVDSREGLGTTVSFTLGGKE